jgi:hypothetical protein
MAGMTVDARGRLDEDPFDYRVTKSGQVLVSRGGRQVATVAGARAARLIAVLSAGDEVAAQLALAKVTGNYRHGNERR